MVSVVGDDGGGVLMSGHFEAADRKEWEEFELLPQDATDATQVAQAGRSLVVVAGVPWITPPRPEDTNTLYFRVFDPDKNKIIDMDETKIPNRTKKIDELKRELRLRIVRDRTGELCVPRNTKRTSLVSLPRSSAAPGSGGRSAAGAYA